MVGATRALQNLDGGSKKRRARAAQLTVDARYKSADLAVCVLAPANAGRPRHLSGQRESTSFTGVEEKRDRKFRKRSLRGDRQESPLRFQPRRRKGG
jgi:hypothetical protein